VVGSLVCDARGQVLADVFPPGFDKAAPARAAEVLADNSAGLAGIGGPVSMLSLRLADARILARPIGSGHLLVLCSPTVNAQPLTLLAAATAPKLEKLLVELEATHVTAPLPLPPAPPPVPAPAPALVPATPVVMAVPPPAPGLLFQAVQRIEAVIVRKKLDPFRTRGAIGMAAGFGLRCIDADTPDDPDMLEKLLAAATAVLGEKP
jgi:hypothetical protein